MKVVLDLRSVHPGMTGIGRYALNLCLSLAGHGSIQLHGVTTIPGADYIRKLIDIPLEIVNEGGGPGWDHLVFPDLLRTLEADILHSPLFILPNVKACKYITTLHDVIPLVRPDLCPAEFIEFFKQSMAATLKRADHVVTVSAFSRQDILSHLDIEAHRVTAIHEPISPFFGRRNQNGKVFDLEPGFILSVGAIDRRKNLSGLLSAFALLRERRSSVPLLVLVGAPSGDGFDVSAEIERRGLSGFVRCLGRVSDEILAELYGAAGVFVFPSLYEGFGLPVVEAMASGTPVVASGTTSIPEIAGDAALFVNPQDPREIEAAIERVLDDKGLRSWLVEQGLARAAQYSLQSQAEKLHQLYERVLAA